MNEERHGDLERLLQGACYDPATRKITLPRNAPPYVAVHEWAHSQQHANGTFAFGLHALTRWIPWVRRWSLFLVEWEADQIARIEMNENDIWDDQASAISCFILRRYALKMLLP